MAPYWNERFGNPHSSDHIVGWRAAEVVQASAWSVGRLIGADPDEVIFTSGATESNNLALLGAARQAPTNRRRILVSAIEHKCVLAAGRVLREYDGFSVETVPVDSVGLVDVEALADMLDENVLLASVMAVNNEVGSIQDVPRIARLLKHYDVLFHCDAAQAPCGTDISELSLHADLVSLSSHKMYGPPGIGVLFIGRDIQERIGPIIHGGGQQAGFRSGTVPLPLCVGLGEAANLLGIFEGPQERGRIAHLRDSFLASLQHNALPIVLNGPNSNRRHPGNANLQFTGLDGQEILSRLQPNVAASTGSACTSGIPEPSHVLRAMGLTFKQANASIRFSFGRFTNDSDVVEATRYVLTAIHSTLDGLRHDDSNDR